MIIIKGTNTDAKIFTHNVESTAMDQIRNMVNNEITEKTQVRIMPDTHAGAGSTIGTTIRLPENFEDWKVSPNVVGVDINCFTGDTKVQLTDGRSLSFIELIDEYNKGIVNYCFSKDSENNTQISKIDLPRKIDEVNTLVHIKLDNGKIIKATKDHIFYKRDGTEVEACKLQKNDSLMPLYIEKIKNVRDNILHCSSKTLDNLMEYLAVYNSGSSTYSVIHHLSDDYNERNGLIDKNAAYDNGTKSYVRHHKDFDKYNNNPDNIERMGYIEHWKYHAHNIDKMNKLGLSGFRRANELNPGLHSRAGERRAEATWRGPNAKQNYIDKRNLFLDLHKQGKLNTPYQRKTVRERQLTNNTNDFANLNSNPDFIWKQQKSKYTRIAQKCIEEYKEINEENWDRTRLDVSKNSPKYNTAMKNLKLHNCSINDLLNDEIKNHKVVSVNVVNYDEPISVYCLTNHEFGNFALDAGVFVSNCGIMMYKIADKGIDLSKLDEVINKKIPVGYNTHSSPQNEKFTQDVLDNLTFEIKESKLITIIHNSLGTLGGGNHFIELGMDENGDYWLAVHSGSRNLGVQVAEHHQKIAVELLEKPKVDVKAIIDELKSKGKHSEIADTIKNLNKGNQKLSKEKIDLAYLQGDLLKNYLIDMEIAQNYALKSREKMLDIICEAMGFEVIDKFDSAHNFIEHDNFTNGTIRKGATSAKKGERLVIPLNMRDGSIIAIGKGNEDWNYSAPHGAGRLMSRSKAKDAIKLEDFKAQMSAVYSTSVVESTIDEAPEAYKPAEEILHYIKPTVDVIHLVKPVYNFKSH